ncbi:hypothetical protein F4860DRAFT_509465 [Xylaria cubensis]|nr:hypothetical protein F4860DRAFT_509465 [Xylaria cubensis]
MSDPLAWLKLGQRSRTPSNPLSSSSPDCKAGRERTLSDLRRPGSSRSSHLARANTGLDSLFTEDAEDDVAANLFVRNQDRIWYNPSLDQMVEALQVLLMTRGVLEPIPLEYNSYILHLIEGFAKARADTRKAEAAHTELKQTLEQNLEQFRLVAEDWRLKEAQYLAEIKKLEVLLSKSSKDGLEVVALARTTSVIDRYSNRRRGFLSRLDEIKRDHFDSSGRPPVPTTPRILDNDNDFLISEKFRKQDAIIRDSAPVPRERRATDLQSGAAPINKTPAAAAAAAATSCSSKSPETVIKAPITTAVVTEERPGDEGPKPGPEATTKGGRGVFRGAFSLKRGRHGPSEATQSLKAKEKVIIGPSNPGRQEDTAEDISTTSSTESSMTLTPGTAHRHERGGSTFSFEAGDDCIPLLGNPAEGYGDFDTASYRQTPTPESSAAAAEECRQRGNVDGGGDAGKERKGIDSVRHPTTVMTVQSPSAVRNKPLLRRGRDSGGGGGSSSKKTTTTAQSSSSQSCDEGQQEGSEKAQTETEARIAAKFALANAFGGGKQKK